MQGDLVDFWVDASRPVHNPLKVENDHKQHILRSSRNLAGLQGLDRERKNSVTFVL